MGSKPIVTESQLLSNIAAVMKHRGVNATWLALKVDMDLPNVWKKVSPKYAEKHNKPRTISAIELYKMATALEISMELLLSPDLMNTDQFWNLKPFKEG